MCIYLFYPQPSAYSTKLFPKEITLDTLNFDLEVDDDVYFTYSPVGLQKRHLICSANKFAELVNTSLAYLGWYLQVIRMPPWVLKTLVQSECVLRPKFDLLRARVVHLKVNVAVKCRSVQRRSRSNPLSASRRALCGRAIRSPAPLRYSTPLFARRRL